MPVFAGVVLAIFNKAFSFLVAYLGFKFALRLTVLLSLAALYISGLTAFMTFVQPLLVAMFATTHGMILGLVFPPVAGTVVTGLATLWVGRITYDYFQTLGSALVK